MLMASSSATTDAKYCITEYCDDMGLGIPQNPFLYSYYPSCLKIGDPEIGTTQCDPVGGCSQCAAGHFRAKNPLVPSAARCVRCEGCPTGLCGAAGCVSCPIDGLKLRTPMPGVTTPSGAAVYACKNSTDPAKAVVSASCQCWCMCVGEGFWALGL
jgi:hypothetical protein